jgi:multiple sugar transport system substrate-binding protein|tara:strand:+ start:988 stop:2361 length:1374 start_codon:yes stop_codon:yes gene_type:complete
VHIVLWLLCSLSLAGRTLCSRHEFDRAAHALGLFAAVCFAVGSLLWLFGDTYSHHFADKDRELRISYWGSYREHQMWGEILDGFSQTYPDIPVRGEYITTRYEEKIQQLLLADEAPDVMVFQDEPMPRFASSGKFEPLDGYLHRPGLSIELDRDYWDTAVTSFQVDGTTFGVPIWGGNCLVFYNREAFRLAGAEAPEDDWTVEDFLRVCQLLTGDDDDDGRVDRYGVLLPGWVYWLPFHYAFGATHLDPSHQRWTLWGERAEASYGFFQDLRHRHHVAPRRDELTESGSVAFMTGRVGMFISGPWAMPFLNEAGVDYDVAHVPSGPGGRGTRVTWDCLAMFSGSKKKDQAWKLIHFVASLPVQRIIARYQRSVPALKQGQEAFVSGNPKVHAERFIEALAYARFQPISLHWALMSREITSQVDMMLDGNQSVQETLTSLVDNEHLRQVFIMPDGGRR